MRVKELAGLAGTTVRTIRYYHRLGLLSVPEAGPTWRSYGFAHLTRLMRIRWLVESGVPLAEVPHMVRPPHTADERTQVEDDLTAVLASMDARIGALTAQRAQVETLLGRVRTRGRLSPLPGSLVHFYAAMLQRPLPESLRVAVTRERDLLELACYRGALPADVEVLVDALCAAHLEEVCEAFQRVHLINEQSGSGLTAGQRSELDEITDRVVSLAHAAEPAATQRLLARAMELDRPAVRSAIELAYPSAAYRHVVRAVTARAAHHPMGTAS